MMRMRPVGCVVPRRVGACVRLLHLDPQRYLRNQWQHLEGTFAIHPWAILAWVLRSPSRLLDSVTSHHHRFLDRTIASITQNSVMFPNGFFCDGWGDVMTPHRLQEILQSHRVHEITEIRTADMTWSAPKVYDSAQVVTHEGSFKSTLVHATEYLPKSSLKSYFELVTPLKWHDQPQHNRPLVVLLPGTGEHGYLHRRTSLAIPLAQHGIASVILEGPLYGKRKPADQSGSKLRRVSDLPILGQATIEEAKSLLAYFRKHFGCSELLVAGSSMGGLHAAMTASVFPDEVGATAWLAPPSAAPVFADGLLAASCNWTMLYNKHKSLMLEKLLKGYATASNSKESEKEDPVQKAKTCMRAFLSITDIDNFPQPKRSDAVIFVVATEDEYVGFTKPQWERLRQKWNPACVRYLKAGHVSGILLESHMFKDTIVECVNQLRTHRST